MNQSERGQGLIELAIALPALLVLLLGVLDVGRVYWSLVTLKDAVSEGASYAAAYPPNSGDPDDANLVKIKELAADSSTALVVLTPEMFSVDYVDPPTTGQPITVTVAYDFVLITPFVNAIVPDSKLTLRATDTHVIY